MGTTALKGLDLKRILLTGMSGTGKSSVIEALKAAGHRAVDADYGYCIETADGRVWDEPKIAALLGADDATELFLAGCEENQAKFYDRFDAIVLLSAPADVIAERIATRTNNPFGKSADERAKIMRDLAEVEPLLRKRATHELDTRAALEDVVHQVLQIARSLQAAR